MPASEKNKQNLKEAVNESYERVKAKDPDRMKNLAKKIISSRSTAQDTNSPSTSSEPEQTPEQAPKKSRSENKAAVQRTLELMRKQKGQ